MDLPKSYSDIYGLYQPIYQKQAQRQLEQQEIFRQQIQSQKAALEEQYLVEQQKIAEALKELPSDAANYPAVKHQFEKFNAANQANRMQGLALLDSQGMPAGDREAYMKAAKDQIERDFSGKLDDFEKTEYFKTVKENWNKLNTANKRINDVVQSISSAKNMLDEGKTQESIDYLRTNVVKQINNLESNDAVAVGEVLFKYYDLLNAPEISEQKNKSVFNPSAYFTKIQRETLRDKANNTKREMADRILSVFEANPIAFIKTAIQGANDHIESYNKTLQEQVVNASSPGVARQMGATPMQRISPFEDEQQAQKASPLATPSPLISGGASNTIAPTLQQPVASPLQTPIKGSTIFRIVPSQR